MPGRGRASRRARSGPPIAESLWRISPHHTSNPEAAIGNYRYFFSHAEPDLWPDPEPFLALLYEAEDVDGLTEFFTSRFNRQKELNRTFGSRDEYVAQEFRKLGLWEPALRHLDQALARSPENGKLNAEVAELAIGAQDWRRAETALLKVIELNPWELETQLKLADVYVLSGNGEAAVALLDALVAESGGDARVHLKIGEAYLQLGKPVEAIKALRRAREIDPDLYGVELHLQRAYVLVGEEEG